MADLSTIVKFAMSMGNKSGAIPPAPQGLLKLKESIEGLPFELLTKSMSATLDQGKILAGIQQLAQQMGGLQNLGGQFQQILGQLAGGTASVNQILAAVGGVTTMTAGLSSFMPASSAQEIASISPGTAQGSPQVQFTQFTVVPSPPVRVVANTVPTDLSQTSSLIFVTSDTLSAVLTGYVTIPSLAANLANYTNTAVLAATYTTQADLAANLASINSQAQQLTATMFGGI